MIISASSSYADIGRNFLVQVRAVRNDPAAVKANAQKTLDTQLTEQQQSQVQALKLRDMEVRNHEQAHLSASGGLAIGGAHFSYTTGPNGKRYATGGEVRLDISEVPGDPEATLRKAETIRRAALAPANPSSQDYSIAAKATDMANKAQMELLRMRQATPTSGSTLDIRV